MQQTIWTPGQALAEHAKKRPTEVVIIGAREDGTVDELTRAALDAWTNRLARRLAEDDVGQGSVVAIVLPTCVEHIVATLAVHKLGACPMPVNVRMPGAERDALLALGKPAVVIGDASELGGITREDLHRLDRYPDTPFDDAVPQPAKAVASGGSTGRPKLIVSPGAFAYPPGGHPFGAILRLESNDLMYSPGPLYHNAPFLFSLANLFQGGRVMINERFHAGRALELIETYRPQVLNLVPTMMQRMIREPDIADADLSSVRILWHLAAPCPEWAKQAWMDRLGPQRIWELWGATEITGLTTLGGDEWLEHRGSVGRGFETDIRILDKNGQHCPTGEVGEIWTRFAGGPPQYTYIGAEPLPVTDDGFCCVGDLGRVDDDGYLYLSDRRVDLIVSGGSNVYPAEVEAVLTRHPGVRDAAVVGIPDGDLGNRVHAIVEPVDFAAPPPVADLDALCREHLSRYKTPRGYEFLAKLPRNEAGKIRRSALRDERSEGCR